MASALRQASGNSGRLHPLVATCWTHAGDAAPGRGDERSPFDVLDRVRAVAECGYAGIGFVHADLEAARLGVGFGRLREEISAAGLTHVEVESLTDWWGSGHRRAISDLKRNQLIEAAAELGAVTVKVHGVVETDGCEPPVHDEAEMLAAWSQLCDDFTAVGTKVALEPMPFSSFPTVVSGLAFAARSGHQGGGVVVDAWHVFRAPRSVRDLEDAFAGGELDPSYVCGVELDDGKGPRPAYEQLFPQTRDARECPGDGDWDLPRLVRVLVGAGFAGPWGVEILSNRHRQLSLEDALGEAFVSAQRVVKAGHQG